MHEKDAILSSINGHGIWSDFLNHNENFMAFFDIKFREILIWFWIYGNISKSRVFAYVFADLIVGENH